MDFFVAWYMRDPQYPQFDEDCGMLVSVASVPQRWRISDLKTLPTRVIVDSGGFRHSQVGGTLPTPRALFARQLHMIEGLPPQCEITLCALDLPILDPLATANDRDRLLYQTLANAYEFKRLTDNKKNGQSYKTLAIVQGFDLASFRRSAYELRAIGFDSYGVGSLAFLGSIQELQRRIEVVQDVVGSAIHVFGVTRGRQISLLKQLGVASIDSSTPIKAGMFNQLFYSDPFRRFVLATHRHNTEAKNPNRLHKPLPCPCPVCHGTINMNLMLTGSKTYNHLRAIHNYFHLKRHITSN